MKAGLLDALQDERWDDRFSQLKHVSCCGEAGLLECRVVYHKQPALFLLIELIDPISEMFEPEQDVIKGVCAQFLGREGAELGDAGQMLEQGGHALKLEGGQTD